MKKLLLFLTACTLSLAQTQIYNVDELIVEALKRSPDINISTIDYEASKKRYDQAFGLYLPKLSLGANLSYENLQKPKIFKYDGGSIVGSLTLTQLLYDFGKTSGLVGETKNLSKAFDATLQEKILHKKKDVKIAYYNVLKNKTLITVNKENLKLNQSQLIRSKRYFEAGIRTKIDVSDAKVNVIKAEIALKNSEFDLKNAFAKLDTIVGFDASTNDYDVYNISTNLDKNLYSALPEFGFTLKEAISYAYEHRPQMLAYRYKTQAQRELVKNAKSTYYPSIYLGANYFQNSATDNTSSDFDLQMWDVGAYISWNLYNGGSDKAKIEEQQLIEQQNRSKEFQTKLRIKENVTRSYIALQKSKKQVKLSQELLTLSKEKFDQVSKQYDHGLADYIKLQEARQGYINAKSDLVINYYNYFSALAVLEAAIGK